ncbi:unnamed protein product [Amoebophrya sp. A120]|nr:unnamed protein product [Amoebophrya sp. A120]|eukprot:GSA120T00004640001.1
MLKDPPAPAAEDVVILGPVKYLETNPAVTLDGSVRFDDQFFEDMREIKARWSESDQGEMPQVTIHAGVSEALSKVLQPLLHDALVFLACAIDEEKSCHESEKIIYHPGKDYQQNQGETFWPKIAERRDSHQAAQPPPPTLLRITALGAHHVVEWQSESGDESIQSNAKTWGWRYSYPGWTWLDNEHRFQYEYGRGERIFVTHRVPLSRGEVEALVFAQKWIGFGNPANYELAGGIAPKVIRGAVSVVSQVGAGDRLGLHSFDDPRIMNSSGRKCFNCQSLAYFTENLVVPPLYYNFVARGSAMALYRTDRRSLTFFMRGLLRPNESFDPGVWEAMQSISKKGVLADLGQAGSAQDATDRAPDETTNRGLSFFQTFLLA